MTTDNIIPQNEAIDRMKAGLPCETWMPYDRNGPWLPTKFADFDSDNQFRKPPEPRREARVFTNVGYLRAGTKDLPYVLDPPADFREVLPDEVTLQRMTEARARADYNKWREENRVGHPSVQTVWVESRRALGLIEEGS